MSDKNLSSYRSLISMSLLLVLIGFSSTACRSTEASSSPAEPAVITPAEAKETSPDSSTAPATALHSEVDPADAYVKDDPISTPVPNRTPISAEAAGEESDPLKEVGYNNSPPADDSYIAEEEQREFGYDSPPADDSYIAGEEQREFFYTGTPVINIPVNEVRASLEQGLPYSEARSMLITNGWEPIVDPTVDTTYDASLRSMHDMGYVEASACSGTGLGFCEMSFAGKDGVTLSVTLTTASEEPNVWGWSVYTS